MEQSELVELAENLLDAYRGLLLVDSFIRIKVELVEGDFVSSCVQDAAPLTWILRLNPSRHNDALDIQYSIVETIIKVLFYPLEIADGSKIKEVRDGLISRLATSFTNLLSNAQEEVDVESNSEEDLQTKEGEPCGP